MKKLSNYYNKNALLTSSATAALHIVITSLVEKSKNKKNDNYIITSPLTFVATTNACVYNNVKIQLCDIENESYNFDLDKLEKIIKKNKIKPLAIIAVHFGGLAINFERLNHISKKYSIPIIDDGSQAMGAKYKNIELGISNHSVATIFSLHPVKTITSGEGGVLLTNKLSLYKKCKLKSTWNHQRSYSSMVGRNEDSWF